MNATAGHIMIDGNTAAALGCVYAGATVGAWYPITPSTSLMDAFKGFCAKLRVDPETGKANYAVIQAEDELRRSAWCSAPTGTARARSPPPAARASR